MQFNLLPFAVEALGYNAKIYKDIDKLYQTRKYEFYRAAKEHELYTHQITTEGALLQEEYCKKALGILLCANNDQDALVSLFDIIRKGWTYAYLFVENNAEIDLYKFMKNIVKKAGGIEQLTDDDINTNLFMVYFLAINHDKKITTNDFLGEFEQTMIDRWQHYNDVSSTRISLKKASPENMKRIKEIKRQIFAQHGFFNNYVGMYGKLRKRAEAIALLYDYEKLSCESVFNTVKFSEKDIDEILLAYLSRYDTLDASNAADFLCDAMYVRYMAKAYNEVKRRYFNNNRETSFVELESMEKNLSTAKHEITRLDELLGNSLDTIKALERENTRLKSELAEEKKNRQELNSLREFIFSLDRQEDDYHDPLVDNEGLKNTKALIIGGHEKWQARMKELLPGFLFIHPDNKAYDLRILNSIDIVFFYVNYLNHAIYGRTVDAIAGRPIKIGYLNQANEERVLHNIKKFLKGDKPWK